MYCSTATIWKDRKDSYKLVHLSNIHIERTDAQTNAAGISGIDNGAIKLFVHKDTPLEIGDYVHEGILTTSEPPTSAMQISSINRYHLHRALHHIEVTAR